MFVGYHLSNFMCKNLIIIICLSSSVCQLLAAVFLPLYIVSILSWFNLNDSCCQSTSSPSGVNKKFWNCLYFTIYHLSVGFSCVGELFRRIWGNINVYPVSSLLFNSKLFFSFVYRNFQFSLLTWFLLISFLML